MTESDLLTEIYYAETKSQLSPHLTPALNLKDQEKRGGKKNLLAGLKFHL